MPTDTLSPEDVLSEWRTGNLEDLIELGISAAKAAQYERGLIFLAEAYRHVGRDQHRLSGPLISFYGLCLALHRGRIKEAAELEAQGFNLIMAVGRGSAVQPRLIHMIQKPAGAVTHTNVSWLPLITRL